MGRDLTNLFIDETYDFLLQKSGSEVQNGLGERQDFLDVSASNAVNAQTASLLLGNAEQVGHIDFSSSAEATPERRLNWNDSAGTLNIGLKGGQVTLQVGQEEVARVVNGTGADLLESQYRVVKVIGAQGQRLQVALAQADSDVNSASTLGIVTENILNNQEGFVTLSGIVRNINTTGTLQGETWNDGDVLYLSGITPGVITNVKPLTPTHLVVVGYVVYAHPTQGKIFVKVDNGYELEELHDVLITSASNGQVIKYDNGIWINSDTVTSSSFATTASFAFNAVSASYAVSASHEIIKEISSSYADYAKSVLGVNVTGSVETANTASYVLGSNVDGPVLDSVNAVSSSYSLTATSASHALNADTSISSSYASTADFATNSTSASYAVTASHALNAGTWDGQYTGDAGITGSLTVIGATQNALRVGTNGSSDYVTIAGPTNPPFTFDGRYIQGIESLRTPNGYKYLETGDGLDTALRASGSATTTVDIAVNQLDPVVSVFNNSSTNQKGLFVTGNSLQMNLENTGSNGLFIDYFGSPTSRAQVIFNVDGYRDGLSNWITTANMSFGQADQAFFSADGDFFVKNSFDGSGSVYVWSENVLTLRGDTGVTIQGDDPSTTSDDINIQGKAFHYTTSTNINGFSISVNELATVKDNTRAFVETPLQVAPGGTVVVGAGSTLKVINEL